MYLHLSTKAEQEEIIRALSGPQFNRKQHGGLFDRGRADSYYGRARDPHYWPEGTGHGTMIDELTQSEIQEYLAGYDYNEQYGDRKNWD
jgi:hypothetical protein